tara:strand:+ start:109 stop:603 length:495 start_codon:yes stop_codon:yes gene_type:complete
MKKITLLLLLISILISCDNSIKEIEVDRKAGEWVETGVKYSIGSDADVAIVKKMLSSHVSLDAEGVFSSISDTLTYYPHNMKSSIKMDVNMLKNYFSQYDSIQKKILYYLPYNVETWNGSIVQVGAVESRFNKNGTIEKDRVIDKFFIGEDGLVHTIREWNADW